MQAKVTSALDSHFYTLASRQLPTWEEWWKMNTFSIVFILIQKSQFASVYSVGQERFPGQTYTLGFMDLSTIHEFSVNLQFIRFLKIIANSFWELTSLFVFSICSREKNGVSLLTPVSDSVFTALSDGIFLFSLHGSLKNHSHKALWLAVGIVSTNQVMVEWATIWNMEQNDWYHLKEHWKLSQKLVSKVSHHFV